MKKVRLTENQLQAIRQAFQSCFQSEDHLWLFGSRANLDKRGGDIDLYVETNLGINNVLSAKLEFARKLFLEFDDRKIDIVIRYKDAKEQDIYQQAIETGVQIL
jgi:hypothetical protein